MRAYEFINEDNPTVTPKSSDLIQKKVMANSPAREKAISDIMNNLSKNMIDQKTATNQLKAQGMTDDEISKDPSLGQQNTKPN